MAMYSLQGISQCFKTQGITVVSRCCTTISFLDKYKEKNATNRRLEEMEVL